ncbi:MAG: hypothetical protein A3B47_03600 [Candidatus Levybacteria bacterium RIFCSPLOWO2_01_FULL_39_24]|nr:MAG: hypothetical protein A2800_04950 [Candidatus Levybacteria bacterium RIFCSPHIGHO2_01_FULL_40_16]OGH28960.1 MAG: hypothetical protein A3E12_01290 [Candidatus Levybacteria bacterium RIFCSPHIGHO2_12_FULL_39_9]OGH46132.1 MAG: hypothetical protein A3B47_03600 [Candidatus Levybacteria bacterium RIFCSPLOWO2_01_FULL_39_24]HJZ06043.1 hypothetical protein [Patescibacteria group bacterium]
MVKTNTQILVDIGRGLSMAVGLPTIASWKTAGRPKKVRKGTFGFNSQTNNLEYWDGTVWFAAPLSKNYA